MDSTVEEPTNSLLLHWVLGLIMALPGRPICPVSFQIVTTSHSGYVGQEDTVYGSCNMPDHQDQASPGMVGHRFGAGIRKSFFPMVWKVLTMDASLLGWGGILYTLIVQGTWS